MGPRAFNRVYASIRINRDYDVVSVRINAHGITKRAWAFNCETTVIILSHNNDIYILQYTIYNNNYIYILQYTIYNNNYIYILQYTIYNNNYKVQVFRKIPFSLYTQLYTRITTKHNNK